MQGSGQSSASIWTAFDTMTTAAVRQPVHGVLVSWNRAQPGTVNFATVGSSVVGGSDIVQGQLSIITEPDTFSYIDETIRVTRMDYERKIDEPLGGLSYSIGTVTFDNTDKRYTRGVNDTVGTSLKPNRPTKLFAGFKVLGVEKTLPVMYGLTDQPYENKNSREAGFNCYDYVSFINDYELESSIYENQRSDQLIAAILQEAGFTSSQYVLETGLNTIEFAWFQKGDKAGEKIKQIVEAEDGHFYQDEQGVLRFRNRRSYNNNQTPVWTINPEDVQQWDEDRNVGIINRCIVHAKPRQVQEAGVIWENGIIQSLSPGGSVTIWASFQDPITTLTTPAAGVDYVANTAENGSGSDLTSDIDITTTLFTTSVELEVTNNGATVAYLTTLQLRGTPATVTSEIEAIYDDSGSQDTYGRKQTIIENDFIDTEAFAAYLARIVVEKYRVPSRRLRLVVRAVPQLQLQDVVSVKDPDLGVYKSYRVMGIKGTMDLGGGFMQTLELRELSDSETDNYAVVGVSVVGGTDVVGI